jgi:hypothetical protein
MRLNRCVSLSLVILLGVLPESVLGGGWQNGLSGMGAGMSNMADELMREELQKEQLERQNQQAMQQIQLQHDLQMQQLQEQQRLFLEQQHRLEADHQRAEQERQKQGMAAAASKAIDAAQMAHLVKTYPDWRATVGAVDIRKQRPDPNNPFRKWLTTKDAAYQTKINGTNSPREVEKAIALFRAETGPSR